MRVSMADIPDNELVSEWVQAMNAALKTDNWHWKAVVKQLDGELERRNLGLKRLNVVMA